jgi:hypothetical protein
MLSLLVFFLVNWVSDSGPLCITVVTLEDLCECIVTESCSNEVIILVEYTSS